MRLPHEGSGDERFELVSGPSIGGRVMQKYHEGLKVGGDEFFAELDEERSANISVEGGKFIAFSDVGIPETNDEVEREFAHE